MACREGIIMTEPKVTEVHPVDDDNQVVTVVGGSGSYRKTPCDECPWRCENDGSFPAEAFRVSAHTSYDMSDRVFACHMSSTTHPMTCAGFILASEHNLKLRLAYATGKIKRGLVHDGDADLHESYRSMAEANGVDPDDPVLRPCR